jgi:hypothetical protein
MFQYVFVEVEGARGWIEWVVEHGSVAILARLHVALVQLQALNNPKVHLFVEEMLTSKVVPALEKYMVGVC